MAKPIQVRAREPDEERDPVWQLYDAVMRRLVEGNLAVVAAWLDPFVAELPASAFVRQASSFSVPVVHADLLTTAGPEQLMHVEYETSPRAGLVQRMYTYRGRVMEVYPGKRLTQYVIVLGNGRVRGFDDLEGNGFVLDLRVVYLRERDPAEFLADPVLSVWAVLASGSRLGRERSLAAAFRLILGSGHPKTQELLQIAEAFATIRLDTSTIDRVRGESGMSIQPLIEFYRDTEVGRSLQEIGRDEGREEGRERLLMALLRARFGDRPELIAVAGRLASWSDEAAVEMIGTVSDPTALLDVDPLA